MRKRYSAPIVEKVVFDYRVQLSTASTCTASIINIKTSESECGEGTPSTIYWTPSDPGQS